MAEPAIRPRRHQIGTDDGASSAASTAAGSAETAFSSGHLEAGTDHRRFLDDLPLRARRAGPGARAAARAGGGHLRGRVPPRCSATPGRRGPAARPRPGRAPPPPRYSGLPPARSRIRARRRSGKSRVESPNHSASRSSLSDRDSGVTSNTVLRNPARAQRIRLERRPMTSRKTRSGRSASRSATAPSKLDGGGVGPVQILDDQH